MKTAEAGVPAAASTRSGPGVRSAGALALVAIMALAVLVGTLPLWTLPAVVPAGAPATEFSAERAVKDLEVIARAPRPLGSAENARVRRYLVEQVRAIGLEPEIQTTTAVNRFPGGRFFGVGAVTNVVVRIPGTNSTGAIALDGHYDAASTGPGASDCGSCVVALLETMRAVKAGPPLRNDVVFVFADGEENMDLGAAAFVAEHPLAKDVRLALNFESMAAGGPSVMYYTSAGNSWLIDEFAGSAPLPLASSFLPSLLSLFSSQQLGCDLDEFVAAGAQGLGFVVYSDDIPAYHTQRDSLANMDPRSIQHDGLYALSAVRHFGNLDLAAAPRGSSSTFFNVLPAVLLHYPSSLALPLAAAVGLLFLTVAAVGFRRGRLSAGGLALGALVQLIAAIAAVALAGVAWMVIRAANPNLQPFLMGNQPGLYLLGLACLIVAAETALYVALSRRVRLDNLAAGALLVWTILAAAVAVVLPAASYVLTWPAAFSLIAFGWLLTRPSRTVTAPVVVVLGLAAAPALVLVAQTVQMVAPLFVRLDAMMGAASGVPLLEAPLFLVALLVGLLVPQLAVVAALGEEPATPPRRWIVPAAALLVAIAAVGLAGARSGFGPAFPRPTSIAYQLDADSGQAVWLSAERDRDAWSARFAPAASGPATATLPFIGLPAYSASAPAVALPAPEARLVSDSTVGGMRTVKLHLSSPRGAQALQAGVELPGELVAATIDEKTLDLADLSGAQRRQLSFTYSGLPAAGFDLVLQLREAGSITAVLFDGSSGLPSIPGVVIGARPADLMPIPGPSVLDPTVVRRTFSFS